MKKKIIITLALVLAISQSAIISYAEDIENSEVSEITDVDVNMKINFTPSEAKAYQKMMSENLEETIQDLEQEIKNTSNTSKSELLKEYQASLEDVDVSDLFEKNTNGTYFIEVPYDDVILDVGGTMVDVSENEIPDEIEDYDELTEDDIEIVDIKENIDYEVDIKDDSLIECTINTSFSEFAQGIQTMEQNMENSEGQAVKCVFYKKRKVNTYIGKGAGRTKIKYNPNIVMCNKCDKSATKKYTQTQFALGNSDCAKSVRLGLIAVTGDDPKMMNYYFNSIHCVNESMGSILREKRTNEYCNGKKKKGGHVNCSWFNGIKHSERFHTHK